MNKQILIKYIDGLSSEKENQQVRSWAAKSDDNREYLASLMNIKALLPESDKRISDIEYDKFIQQNAVRKNVLKWRALMKYAAIVLFVVSLTINIVWITTDKLEFPRDSELSLAAYQQLGPDSLIQEVYVAKGAKSKVTLPDGSIVWLNSDSKIRFPLAFSVKNRNVYLSGEAFFDVVHNEQCPMVVSMKNNYYIEVLGTQFNLRSYEDDKELQATLYTGKINILSSVAGSNSLTKICEMQPNETFVVGKRVAKAPRAVVKKVSEDGMSKINAWKSGRLYFDSTPMQEVIKSIERWHGVTFNISDDSILNYTITAKFDNESAVQIMEMLKLCAPLDYSIRENIITISHK